MRLILFIVMLSYYNTSFSQCNEVKNLDGFTILKSIDESFIGAIGERFKDSLFISVKKVIDVDEIRYSIFLFVKSKNNDKYIEYSYLIPHMPDALPINIGVKDFKYPVSGDGYFLKSVSSTISESNLKRFLFADNFTFGAFGDNYIPDKLLFKKWKLEFRKCIDL